MHSSSSYLIDDYWTLLSDCAWRYLGGQDSWRPVLMAGSASDCERGGGDEL